MLRAAFNFRTPLQKTLATDLLADLHQENKVVQQFVCPTAEDRCHVRLLDLYVSKLPNGAKEKDAFYFTALPRTRIPQYQLDGTSLIEW